MAEYIATASKDPSTKVGALIVRPDRTSPSWGYNGFPRGIHDTDERLNDRDQKYALTLHAEENAFLTAKEDVAGCTLYTWPLFTCSGCALKVIQKGIKRVVSPANDNPRWVESLARSQRLYDEAGVEYKIIDMSTANAA